MRLVYITLAWFTGIVLAKSDLGITPTTWLLATLGLLVVCWTLRDLPGYRFAAVLAAALALGGLRMALHPTGSAVAAYNNAGGLTLEGVVVAEPDVRDEYVGLRLDAETVTFAGATLATDGLVLVRAPRATISPPRYGDRLRATGRLITPAEYDTFSYADFLARGGVFSVMRDAVIEPVSSGHGSAFFAVLLDLRARARDHINRYLPEPAAGLLNGILLGDESGLSPALEDDFSAAGASHVIAISGFNMVIVSGVVARSLSLLRVPPRAAMFIALAVIGLYTLFVGANAAVVRAALMASLLVIAEALKRRTYLPASLAFVVLAMSAQNPTVIDDLSFQLSFFATLGLALFADPLGRRFEALLHRLFPEPFAVSAGALLAEPLVVTTAALITTTPLTALYFGRFSLAVLPVNLLIVPVQTALFLVGALALLLAFALPALAQLAFWACLALLSWTISVVRLFAAQTFAQVELNLDARLVVLFFVGIIGGGVMNAAQPEAWVRIAAVLRRRALTVGALSAAAITALLTFAVVASRPDGRLHVHFLDVGHTDAVLIQSPGGAHILVNGGRFPARLLTALGDRLPFHDQTLEVLVVTQPDEFHIAALPAVLARYATGIVLTNGQPNQSDTYVALQTALAGRQALAVTAGYTLDFDDGLRLEVLSPARAPDLGDPLGAGALTLRLVYGEISVLLTSQLNREGQAALLDAGGWPLATVMQMPAQGGRAALSESFYAAVQPSLVVLQSDAANLLGDPNGDTLALLGQTPLLRTDEGGALHLWTDGRALWAVQER